MGKTYFPDDTLAGAKQLIINGFAPAFICAKATPANPGSLAKRNARGESYLKK